MPSTKSLILVPSVITLGITLLRLVGERAGWSPLLFSREAGGAGALVGIVWLVPIFGWLFGARLARAGTAPAGPRALVYAVVALALVAAAGFGVGLGLHKGPTVVIPTVMLTGLIGCAIVWRGWPALARVLLAYGLAARVPVILVMLVAMLGNWGTHYDVVPPGFAADTPVWTKWFQIGVMPQLFLWIPYTILVGALIGGLAVLAVRPARR
jgi:hypothetical protein